MPKFKLLVFDWDGTLMDSQGRIVNSFQAAIADLQLEYRNVNQIRTIIGLGLEEGIIALFPTLAQSPRLLLAKHYYDYFWSAAALPTPLFSGIAEMLQTLHATGYWLAVATGKSRLGLNRSLNDTGLQSLFLSSRCAEETSSKPHPQMLQEIMAELEVSNSETLMVGDTDYDLQMANNAGVASVAVSYGMHEKDRLLKCRPLVCLDDLSELPVWLQNFES